MGSIIDSTAGGEREVRDWYLEGKSFAWMVREYERKYGLEVSAAMFSYRRAARGWERRRVRRDDRLFPWVVRDEHRWHRLLSLLRLEARARQLGIDTMPGTEVRDLMAFREQLEADDVVVHYDPHTETGFVLVPRDDRDTDIVRQPTLADQLR